jgi:cell division protein FtsQ
MTTGTTFIRSHAARQAPPALVLPDDVRWMRNTANLLFAVAGLLLVGIVLLWFTRQPVFALGSIRIEGDMARNSVATIRVNAVPKLRGNFFSTDLKADQRAFESVPWVRRAVVRRVWPNRLAVSLEEHRPAAVWRGGELADQMVNTVGEVFEANIGDVEDDSLPVLEGPPESSAEMLAMLHRLETVFAAQDARIDRLRLSGRASWSATLDTGAVIELGRGSDDEVVARAGRFVATVAQLTRQYQRPIASADLRHRDGYAVRLRGVTTTAPQSADPRN